MPDLKGPLEFAAVFLEGAGQSLVNEGPIEVVRREGLLDTGSAISSGKATGRGQRKPLIGEKAFLGELVEQAGHCLLVWFVL